MSREKSEKVCITFRLSEEEHEKLKQYSSACGLSTAEFKSIGKVKSSSSRS